MNLLSSPSLLNTAADRQVYWHRGARDTSQTLAAVLFAGTTLKFELEDELEDECAIASMLGDMLGEKQAERMEWVEEGADSPNDTIVSDRTGSAYPGSERAIRDRANVSIDPDRFFSLPHRQESICEIFSEGTSQIMGQMASQINGYRHNGKSESLNESLLVGLNLGLNLRQPSGRYGPKPNVPK